MGFPGVELRWHPGSDNNWIAYHEIFRDDAPLDKVAKGDSISTIPPGQTWRPPMKCVRWMGREMFRRAFPLRDPRSHDLELLTTLPVAASTSVPSGSMARRSLSWLTTEQLLLPNVKGATAELSFEGKRVLWFTKLGAENGEAAVSIDGGPA